MLSRRLFLALLFFALLLEAIPVGAVPARRLTEELPPAAAGAEACELPAQRLRSGPGRRPGATVVPVVLRLEVQDESGQFRTASHDRTRAIIADREVTLRVTVMNLSLYDVGRVIIRHSYQSGFSGEPAFAGIGSVTGARYEEGRQTFRVDRVPSDASVEFTFRLFLTDAVGEELLQSKVTLEDFDVLEAERRHPRRLPETPESRSTQTVAKLGIGSSDVACFAARAYRRPSFEILLPPVLTPLAGSALSVEKSANLREAQPGAAITYTILVFNRGSHTLRNIVVDDRFSPSHLKVLDAGGGDLLASGLRWVVPEIASGERFIARYRAEVLSGLQNGERIPNTVTVISEQLRDIPTAERQASAEVAILTRMPRTGVELRLLFLGGQIVLGIALTFLLLRLSLTGMLFAAGRMRNEE